MKLQILRLQINYFHDKTDREKFRITAGAGVRRVTETKILLSFLHF